MTKDYNKNNFVPQIKIKSTKIASSLLLMSINWRQRFIVILQENIDDNSCYLGIQTTIASDKKKKHSHHDLKFFSSWAGYFQYASVSPRLVFVDNVRSGIIKLDVFIYIRIDQIFTFLRLNTCKIVACF